LGVKESARRHGETDESTTSDYLVFDPAASLGHFSSKMSKELPSLSMTSATAPNEFLLPKFEEEDTDDI